MTLEEMSVVFSADVQPFAQAVESVQAMVSGAVQAVDSMAGAFFRAGLQAASGLRDGLLTGKDGVVRAAETLAQAAAQAMRSVLQIRSPSRVTREMGRMFDEGFRQGIGEHAPQIGAETRRLSRMAAEGLQDAQGGFPSALHTGDAAAPLQPVHVTVPLEIDGWRLGMAVIENINRIRQATGRVELQL